MDEKRFSNDNLKSLARNAYARAATFAGSVKRTQTSLNYMARGFFGNSVVFDSREASPGAVELTLSRVVDLWNADRKDFALKTVQAFLVKYPRSSRAWFWLGQRYAEIGEHTAASLSVKNAVDTDPTNLEALAVYVDLAYERNWTGAVTRAYGKLAARLPSTADVDRGSLAFFLPSKFGPGVAALAHSKDPVVRELLSRMTDSSITVSELKDDEEALVNLYENLLRGRRQQFLEAIKEVKDSDVPLVTMQVMARRYLRAGKRQMANSILSELVKYDLGDGWARAQLEKLSGKQLTNYQLARSGFPFGPVAKKPAFEPVMDKAFYLLHNSLPYHSAGYSTRTHGLLSSVRNLGWDVQGVTRLGYPFDMPKFEDAETISPLDTIDGVPYHRLSVSSVIERKSPVQNYVARYSKSLEALARREKPFLIHAASNHWNGLTAVETANRLGLPSVYEVRGLWEVTRGSRDPEWAKGGMYRFMARMEADAAKKATKVLTITGALKEELVRRGVDENKIVVLPNGADTDRFTPVAPDLDLKHRLGLEDKTVIGYVGSVLDYEGLGLLIDAARILKSEGENFAVMIVGDGAELEKFKTEVEDANLNDAFVFTGRVPHEEVEKYYSIVDITPFPRLPLPVCEMVSPLKPFEAMAMQKAVIASDVQALTEIVKPGYNGLLHEKGSAESLAAGISQYLSDPSLMELMAKNGREWVVAERQWKDLGKIVADTYLELGGQLRAE